MGWSHGYGIPFLLKQGLHSYAFTIQGTIPIMEQLLSFIKGLESQGIGAVLARERWGIASHFHSTTQAPDSCAFTIEGKNSYHGAAPVLHQGLGPALAYSLPSAGVPVVPAATTRGQ